MALEDTVTTTREDIISMVSCRLDYGHGNQIASHFFWTMLGEKLTDEEITQFSKSLHDPEAEEEIVEDLQEWKRHQEGK